MLSTFIFSETTPAAAGTAASSQPVSSSDGHLASGVAGYLNDAESIDVFADLVGATGGTLDVYLQVSPDGNGAEWYDALHFPQLASGASAISYRASLSKFTQPTSAAPVVVGKGLSPALAATTVVQGVSLDRVRLVFVAGSGTTAGAAAVVTVSANRKAAR